MLKGEKIGATERFSSVDGRGWDKNSELPTEKSVLSTFIISQTFSTHYS